MRSGANVRVVEECTEQRVLQAVSMRKYVGGFDNLCDGNGIRNSPVS